MENVSFYWCLAEMLEALHVITSPRVGASNLPAALGTLPNIRTASGTDRGCPATPYHNLEMTGSQTAVYRGINRHAAKVAKVERRFRPGLFTNENSI